jgi:hypothetical protein
MMFRPLFRLKIRHDYYSDNVCKYINFEATPETKRLLSRYRLQLKELPDGVVVLMGIHSKAATNALQINEIFIFQLKICHTDLALFTDFKSLESKQDPFFCNTDNQFGTLELCDGESWKTENIMVPDTLTKLNYTLTGNPLALNGDTSEVLQGDDFNIRSPERQATVVAYDPPSKQLTIETENNKKETEISLSYRTKLVRDKKILARVELRYDPSMAEIGGDDALFEIKLKALTARWVYYLISDQKGDFTLVDLNKTLSFNSTDMNQASDKDPLALTLVQQYTKTGLKRIRFVSDKKVPYSRNTHSNIELRLDGVKVLTVMPSPSIRQFSRIKQQVNGEWIEQNTLYQVVKYIEAQ